MMQTDDNDSNDKNDIPLSPEFLHPRTMLFRRQLEQKQKQKQLGEATGSNDRHGGSYEYDNYKYNDDNDNDNNFDNENYNYDYNDDCNEFNNYNYSNDNYYLDNYSSSDTYDDSNNNEKTDDYNDFNYNNDNNDNNDNSHDNITNKQHQSQQIEPTQREEDDDDLGRFTKAQNKVLVNMWIGNKTKCESSMQNLAWDEITDEINKVGPRKNKKQVKRKLANLKSNYKKAQKGNKVSGDKRNSCAFYEEIDSVMATRDVMTMPAVVHAGGDDVTLEEVRDSDDTDEPNSSVATKTSKGQKRKRKAKDMGVKNVEYFDMFMQRFEAMEKESREMLQKMDENSNNTILKLAELLK